MRITMLSSILLVLPFLGCASGPQPRSENKPVLPQLAGRPAYSTPLDQADEGVQQLWAEAQAILSSRLGTPETNLGVAGYSRWIKTVMAPWLRSRLKQTSALSGESKKLPPTPRNKLFIALLTARIHEDTINQLQAMPPPVTVRNKEKVAQAFRAVMNEQLGKIARPARAAYQRCVKLTDQVAPPLRDWRSFCAERAEKLLALAKLPKPRRLLPPRSLPKLPPQCEGETRWEDPQAPPPDETQKQQLAVIYKDDQVTGQDRQQLLAAVAQKLHQLLKLPIVPVAAVLQAERLHAQRRLRAGSPVCGQAPPLPAILAQRYKNLVLAHLETNCHAPLRLLNHSPPARSKISYMLEVWFNRAGSNDRQGLPSALFALLEKKPTTAADWIAAAPRLGKDKRAGVFGVLSSLSAVHSVFSIVGHEQYDPWLRIAPTLQSLRDQLVACHPGRGVSSFEASFTISPVGAPSQVVVAAQLVAPNTKGDEVAACLRRVLEKSVWPCTPSNKPAPVKVRLCLGR